VKKIYFATTNEGKLKEAESILGIKVIGTPLEIEEIQSLEAVKVATQKAKDYFKILKKPIFAEDMALSFSALKGFPGTYIKDFLDTFGNKGLVELIKGNKDRTAYAQTTIVYIDREGLEHVFTGIVKGKISDKPKGDKGFGWDPIFIPEGENKTFGEMELNEKNKYSMRAKALKKLSSWLNKNT